MSKYIPKVISAVVGLALVGGGIYLIATGHAVEGGGLIAGGLGTLALPRVAEPSAGGES